VLLLRPGLFLLLLLLLRRRRRLCPLQHIPPNTFVL
jgi:hypothetical protein